MPLERHLEIRQKAHCQKACQRTLLTRLQQPDDLLGLFAIVPSGFESHLQGILSFKYLCSPVCIALHEALFGNADIHVLREYTCHPVLAGHHGGALLHIHRNTPRNHSDFRCQLQAVAVQIYLHFIT